jgi:uncharacterized SAM-binding protein YcdF (DUF218 family)
VSAALETLKLVGGPGSIGFLAFCCAMGLAVGWVSPRLHRIGRAWLLMVFVAYAILGLPWVATAIANRLPNQAAAAGASLPTVDALVVLSGDNAVGRAQEAARVYRLVAPSVVVVSGEQWLVDRIKELGIPAARLVLEHRSRNTREQIAEVQRRWPQWHGGVALIASRLQMPRVAGLARKAGLRLTLLSAPIDREPPTHGLWAFVPTYAALRLSRDALYEHAALAYYRRSGWIDR